MHRGKGTTGDQGRMTSLLDDIRLVVKTVPIDEVLEVKVEEVEKELQAIDQALADEGTYLGIVDKVELEKRKKLLEWRLSLLKQERELLHALHVALREEETTLAAAEPAEMMLVSSPEPHESNQTAVETAGHSSPSSVGTPATFPSSQSTVPNLYSYSLPSTADHGIDDFLMKNAAVGMAGGTPGVTNSVAPARLLGRDARGRGNRSGRDSDVDEDLT